MSAHKNPTRSTRVPTPKPMALPPLTGSALLTEEDWARTARTLRLSGRELEIVREVFDNHTEHAMAANHFIADGTVHTHLKRLYHKLAVTTRVALVLRVMEAVLANSGCSDQLQALASRKKRTPLQSTRLSPKQGTPAIRAILTK
jgi:DNA-binding CsgD family transcriptional regulator